MKISEYIACLEKIKDDVGDVEVQMEMDGRREARAPSIAHELILQGREHKPRFWIGFEGYSRCGKVVCRV